MLLIKPNPMMLRHGINTEWLALESTATLCNNSIVSYSTQLLGYGPMTGLQELLTSFNKLPAVGTNSAGTPAEVANANATNERRNAWQRLIDEELIEWGRHPEQFEDEDGYLAPTPDNLVRATELIDYFRDHGVLPPLRMAPDGEGGIIFDWKNDSPRNHVIAQILPDGVMELLEFHDGNLVKRKRFGAEKSE